MEILNTIGTVLAGLLMLTVLVVIHEGGHFAVGRVCGIRINEFSVGFGPKLFSRKKGEIAYSVRALPLGGFVQFYGEEEEVDAAYEPRAFNNRPIWQRALTIAAGPAMNILFALLLTVGVLVGYGDYVPEIVAVEADSPAAAAGLQEGDRIVRINGKRIDFSMEFDTASIADQQEVTLGVERADGEHSFVIQTAPDAETGKARIGIQYTDSARRKFGFFEAIGLSFKWLWLIVREMVAALGGAIFGGKGLSELSGPVGTIAIVGESVRYGFETILRMAALLSINLGIMNILPFPALDGGRLLFLGIEKLRGKPASRKVEGYVNFAGLAMLFLLMIVLTYQDIVRLFA